MIQNIINTLEKLDIMKYLINENEEESLELFFIKKSLDMKRKKKIVKYQVTVYHDFSDGDTKFRGASSTNLYRSMTDDEIEEALKDAYFAAGFVKNPYFDIPSGTKEDKITCSSDLDTKSFEDIAKDMTEALFEEDQDSRTFLNSAELFITKNTYRIVNSEGIDVSYDKSTVKGEFLAQCTDPTDVETYQSFYYDDLEADALKKKVRDTLDMTTARAKAKTPPKAGEYKVILSGKYVRELLFCFVVRAASNMIYPKYSNYKVGDMVQGKDIAGDLLNIDLIAKKAYSEEGIQMINRTLLEDGELKVIHGVSRFASYLGIEPTGFYDDISLKEGSVSLDEMKQGQYLHIVNFSDFQMDTFTGYFGGEIRLAFYSDGTSVIPVTGGSISGNMNDAAGCFTFSGEMQKEQGYEGPFAVSIDKVTIGGE